MSPYEVIKTLKLRTSIGLLLLLISAILSILSALLPWGIKEGKPIFLPHLPIRRSMELSLSFSSSFILLYIWIHKRLKKPPSLVLSIINLIVLSLLGISLYVVVNNLLGDIMYIVGLVYILSIIVLYVLGVILTTISKKRLLIEIQIIREIRE